jgi:tungstate transport system substrate-binding protein
MPSLLWRAALLILAISTIACGNRRAELRLATTTSVDNSGLLTAILPGFQQSAGAEVKVLAVGSGRAIELLKRRDADVAITHDPVAETALLKSVPDALYRKIMFNDFLIVGPSDDPAGVAKAATAVEAMSRVAASGTAFASRGDESGTHARETQLWAAAEVKPLDARLLETGQGMAPTLRIASERRAYTLTDRATFMQLSNTLALRVLFEGDASLLNTYAVMVLPHSPPASPAMKLAAWLSEGDGRSQIAAFGASAGGPRPFTAWPADRPSASPDALPR